MVFDFLVFGFTCIFNRTMEPLKSLSGAERKALYKMAIGSHGIWTSYRSLVKLCNTVACQYCRMPYNTQLGHLSNLEINISLCWDSVVKHFNHNQRYEASLAIVYSIECIVCGFYESVLTLYQ